MQQNNEQKPELKPTVIWKCRDASCKAWVREDFATGTYPPCPICKGETIRSYKHLPAVAIKKTQKIKKRSPLS